MANLYLYVDETGNLAFDVEGTRESPYFGFGTALFPDGHGDRLWESLRLRVRMAQTGGQFPKGFHAVDDSAATRHAVFSLIQQQAPRIDTTFLLKSRAIPSIREAGQMRLYKMAWYLHLKFVAEQVASRDDHLYVIAGTFGTNERKTQARAALEDVCNQVNRDITLCVWESSSSWGLQVADYALWAVQRQLLGRSGKFADTYLEGLVRTIFKPWGSATQS